MKGAAAALAAAALFFLGVLTGAREGDRRTPPPVIRLGGAPATPATGEPPDPPEAPESTEPPPAPPAVPEPAGERDAGGAGAAPVEEVEGRVECVDTGEPAADQGAGAGRDGCPPGQTRRPAEPPGEGPADAPGQSKEAGDGGR